MNNISNTRDCFNIVKEMINFIKVSPKRLATFQNLQSPDMSNLRPLCPTRWLMRASSVKSILNNYESLMEFFENLSSISISRYDVATKCSGFLRNLISFDFFFALNNIIKILGPVEELQKTLQSPNISLRNIQSQIDILKDLLTTYRQDEKFSVFWNEIVSKSKEFDLEEPILPKIRRKPKRILTKEVIPISMKNLKITIA